MKYLLRKYYFLSIFLFIFNQIFYAQNETNNWYFGGYSGLNFNNGQMSIQYDSSMTTPAGCSSISDKDGNLMFYTNGETVWNKNHEIMENGDGLNAEITNNQSSIIIPDPIDDNIYFILTTRISEGDGGIFYSKAEFSSENPLGVITDKNIVLTTSSTERITAVYSPETNSVKAVGLGKINGFSDETTYNTLYVLNIGTYGTFTTSNVSLVNTIFLDETYSSTLGVIKFSPNGEVLAIGDVVELISKVNIYNFDILSNSVIYQESFNAGYILTPIPVEGLEFSPDSEIIYFSGNYGSTAYLHKYIINTSAAFNEKILIATSQNQKFGALQLASNSKIYMASYTDDAPHYFDKLSVINTPENIDDIGLQINSITFAGSYSTKGLPNFVTSYFKNRIIAKDDCFYNAIDFSLDAYATIDSVLWEFGDGTTSTSLNPTHQYSQSGTYTVRAVISVNNTDIELFKKIQAFPVAQIENNYTISQCDIDNDGVSLFNLNDVQYGFVNNSQSDVYQFEFYTSLNDAQNQNNPITNSQQFQNTSNPQQLFVNIETANGCISTDSFFIEVLNQNLEVFPPYIVCDDSDEITDNNIGRFDLYQKSIEIRDYFNLTDDNYINFYASSEEALTDINPIYSEYLSSNTTLWIIIRSNNGECGSIASMDLIVNSSIDLDILDTYQLCELQDNPILDGNNSNDTWAWSDHNGNILSTQRFFQIPDSGNYNVTVTKTENGLTCSYSKDFTVLDPVTPVFENIAVDGTTLSISIDGDSIYEFSLDNETFVGQSNNHTFQNITPGVIDIFVRDVYDCEQSINTQFSYIFFPKFFTPNNDRINDKWIVYGINDNLYKKAEITIYDRYGKRLYSFSLNTIRHGWDGKYKKVLLPNSDYWYKASFVDKNNVLIQKTGHFTLKR